jgi:hypothetical protein
MVRVQMDVDYSGDLNKELDAQYWEDRQTNKATEETLPNANIIVAMAIVALIMPKNIIIDLLRMDGLE